MEEVLRVKDLHKTFRKGFIPKKSKVLKGVNFSLKPGTVTGFLGGNGAGKTTTIKCILGLNFPDSGEVHFFGGQALNRDIKKRIGFLPERPYFYDYLTGREFLRFYGQISQSLKTKDLMIKVDNLLARVDLSFAANRALRDYSKGMLQKIGLAQALIHDPEFVILDEPMSGMDPDGRYALSQLISEVAQQGTSVFFSSHLLNDVEKLCDDLVILKEGQVIYQGTVDSLLVSADEGMEISHSVGGADHREVISDPGTTQKRLSELIAQGHHIQEVRPIRKSLEEIFINLALKPRGDHESHLDHR